MKKNLILSIFLGMTLSCLTACSKNTVSHNISADSIVSINSEQFNCSEINDSFVRNIQSCLKNYAVKYDTSNLDNSDGNLTTISAEGNITDNEAIKNLNKVNYTYDSSDGSNNYLLSLSFNASDIDAINKNKDFTTDILEGIVDTEFDLSEIYTELQNYFIEYKKTGESPEEDPENDTGKYVKAFDYENYQITFIGKGNSSTYYVTVELYL